MAIIWKIYSFYNLIMGAKETIMTVQEKDRNGSDF